MIFFLRSFFAQIFLNAFILFRIWRSSKLSRWVKVTLTVIYSAETGLYLVGFFGSDQLSFETYSLIQKVSGIWVIAHIYIGTLLLFFDLFNLLKKKFALFKQFSDKTVRRAEIVTFILFFLFISTQLYIGYNNFLRPKVKSLDFNFNLNGDNRQNPKTYKLLVVADIHLGYIINKRVLQQYVEIINAQNPDIVVIDGDLIDYDLKPLVAKNMKEEFKEIKAPKGVYFVPGNHEYKRDPKPNFDWIASTGVTLLKDSVVQIDDQLLLIGRDDRSNLNSSTKKDNRMPVDELMQKVDFSKACIYFVHRPNDVGAAYKYNIPLTISGHTHQGQAFPVNLINHLLYKNPYGLLKDGNCTFYTTSGLGLSGFPLRISSHSEIVIFNITIN